MPALDSVEAPPEAPTMALAARGSMYFAGQNRLLPRQRAVVRFGDGGRGALPAMADRASKLIELMRNHRMRTERLAWNIV